MSAIDVKPRSLREIAERYPAFPLRSLRWAIFNASAPPGTPAYRDYAGLRPAIIRVGRRVLLDEAQFQAWLDSRRQS